MEYVKNSNMMVLSKSLAIFLYIYFLKLSLKIEKVKIQINMLFLFEVLAQIMSKEGKKPQNPNPLRKESYYIYSLR